MMLAWSFAARAPDEIARLLRALGRHRYVRDVDHRIHWLVDYALADLPLFAPYAQDFDNRRKKTPSLELASRDSTLWREAKTEEVIAVLDAFWTPNDALDTIRSRLTEGLLQAGLSLPTYTPFSSPPDDPPHPELVLLDWELFPVDELDTDRHAGALTAMAEAEEEVNASEPVYQEGPTISVPELLEGAPNGVLRDDFLVWSNGPYSYADYVFRGAAKSAKLVDPPVGYWDL